MFEWAKALYATKPEQLTLVQLRAAEIALIDTKMAEEEALLLAEYHAAKADMLIGRIARLKDSLAE